MDQFFDEAILRILWAVLVGAIIGFERELTQKSAGLRTHILVCLGSTVFTIISVADLTQGMLPADLHVAQAGVGADVAYRIVRDPGRIAAQIVTGIGFIGGGALLRHGATVRGLTTAASLWMVASVGMLVGAGYYKLSLMATLVTFLVLFPVGRMERRWFRKHLKPYNRMEVKLRVLSARHGEVQEVVEKLYGSDILEVESTACAGDETHTLAYLVTYTMDVSRHKYSVSQITKKLDPLEGVESTSVRLYEDEAG